MPTETFISVAELGSLMQKTIPEDDANAQLAVRTACVIIANHVERPLTEAAEVVSVNGSGRSAVNLPEWPITEVRSVLVDGKAMDASAYAPTREGSLLRLDGSVWPAGLMNVTVDYTHGWVPAEMPVDIKLVALRVARRIYLSIGESPGGMRSETIGDYSYTLAEGISVDDLLTQPEKTILSFYKRP